jgi:hypothetical protein
MCAYDSGVAGANVRPSLPNGPRGSEGFAAVLLLHVAYAQRLKIEGLERLRVSRKVLQSFMGVVTH